MLPFPGAERQIYWIGNVFPSPSRLTSDSQSFLMALVRTRNCLWIQKEVQTAPRAKSFLQLNETNILSSFLNAFDAQKKHAANLV